MKDISETGNHSISFSRYLVRRVLLVLILILLLLLSVHWRFIISTIEFFYKMEQLPPWPKVTSDDTVETYSLDEEKQIARLLLEQTEQDRRRMILVYQMYIEILSWKSGPGPEVSPASKLFVLLRLLFDAPEEYPQDEARFFGGWIILQVHENGSWTMDDPPTREGMVNMLWPLGYEDRRLILKGIVFGYQGFTYNGLREYDYFASRFPLRSADDLE